MDDVKDGFLSAGGFEACAKGLVNEGQPLERFRLLVGKAIKGKRPAVLFGP